MLVEWTRSAGYATQFSASVELDPLKAKMQFATLGDEVVQNFTVKHGVNLTTSIDIQASSSGGFDDSLRFRLRRTATSSR